MYVTNMSTKKITKKKGNKVLITESMLMPLILQPVNKIGPTGGVIVPKDRLNTIKIPNCTGCIPKSIQMGKRMGVKINTAGVGSIKVPINNKTKLMINSINIGLSVSESKPSAIMPGICVKAITQDIIEDVPIINITIEAIFTVLKRISGKSLIFSCR